MTVYPIQADFSRGELDPELHARIDIAYYKSALKTCTNWTVLKKGGLRKRSGFKMVREVKDSTKRVRLVPFVFSITQPYVVEMGDLYARYYANGGQITTGGGTPTAITKANPAVVTLNAHGFSNGERVYATNIGGMVELLIREFTVAGATANSFQLSGVDSSSYTTFTSGGTFKKIVETVTPYPEASLTSLDYAQTADVLTIANQSYQPRELTRTSDTAWSLNTATMLDGPYLDEPINNTNGLTPNITNAIHPKMTSNTLPSGTAADNGGGASAWHAFSQDLSLDANVVRNGWIEYNPGFSTVVDHYSLTMSSYYFQGWPPSTWIFQGYTGSVWVDLDRQANQSSWGSGETRYYEIENTTSYQKYRFVFLGANDAVGSVYFSQINMGYNGDFAPTMTLTFDNTTGVNAGAGFTADDIGRPIRFLASDGKWRWFRITGVTSTTVVTGRMYGYALPGLSKIYRWKLGAFRENQWPGLVSFYESRRVFARSPIEPEVVWLSKTFDFYDFGTSQPLVEDDGMRLKILSNRVNALTWLSEGERLALGTVGNVRVLDKANQNQGFGATNFDQKRQVATGSKQVKPIEIGSVLLYADYYGKSIREFVFDLNQDGYIAPDATILSEHLLSYGIVEMAYQATPDSTVWIACADGSLVAMTYEPDQKIPGLTRVTVAPGDTNTSTYVESVCSIPGSMRDEVWIAVRRTINGVTKRYIETLAPEFKTRDGMVTADANFLDSSLTYSGSATGTVNGLNHLIGRTVYALADGVVFRDLTVAANGSVTLPNSATASKITIGLPYRATLTTLGLNEVGQQDGTAISRRKLLSEIRISVMDALGLKAQGLTAALPFDVFRRDVSDPPSGQMNLRTGVFPLNINMSHRDDGQFTLYSDDPLPCTLRGIIFGADGEP